MNHEQNPSNNTIAENFTKIQSSKKTCQLSARNFGALRSKQRQTLKPLKGIGVLIYDFVYRRTFRRHFSSRFSLIDGQIEMTLATKFFKSTRNFSNITTKNLTKNSYLYCNHNFSHLKSRFKLDKK